MKISKNQIQKIALTGMCVAGGLYFYCFEMMAPLTARETKALKEIAALEPKIKDAKIKVARTNAIESADIHAAEARRITQILRTRIPRGHPVAWLPTRLSEFFKRQGIPKPVFRPLPETSEPEFPGFANSTWIIDIGGTNFAMLGAAIAGLENNEGAMQITDLQIDPSVKQAEMLHTQLTISTLVKREK